MRPLHENIEHAQLHAENPSLHTFSEDLVPDSFLKALDSYDNFEIVGDKVFYEKNGLKVRKLF